MADNPPVVVHPLSRDGGRRVTITGDPVGLAYHVQDVIEFLRRAGFSDTETAIDDPDLIEWRGGGRDEWSEPRQ
ncbi:hypothetical protein ACFU5O_33330 [Streptomyces sp. NPDC057445]|uniref:hypothetical protein n=1 Tax=Streptomyces sp. NPDC057445 TaxID=3346136 RepID=UPI0036B7B1B2